MSTVVSTVRAYALPLILLAGALLYQLVPIPTASPPSHYDVLQIERHSSIETVQEAYAQWSLRNSDDAEISDVGEFIKMRYAYELLTNRLWKRDYDMFGIDEQFHVVESATKLYAGKNVSKLDLDLPLLHSPALSIDHSSSRVITASDFGSLFPDEKPWIIQLYSSGSNRCAEFSKSWNKIASVLDGVANIGVMELGEIEKELADFLADKRSKGKPFFRKGVPSIVAIPPRCGSVECFRRLEFDGELTVDMVTNWFATTVLALPQINYYSKESLVPKFLGKTSHHKVQVIFFSETGERATPAIRQAAKDYREYANFAFVLLREEDSSYWMGAFGVESAPAVVFLKDPGVKPVVHHGSLDDSLFLNMMENNKQQELAQLRSATSMELGCDPRGYSRAGYDTTIWYCAIAVGRPSQELNKMRETMCRVQETLAENQSVDAVKRKRLTFAWLDGEKQKDYCQFYLGSTGTEHTCGQRKSMIDIPRLFVIRYLRNATAVDSRLQEMAKWKSLLVQDLIDDSDQAGQFIAGYKGEVDDVSQISEWLTNITNDGDSRDLPFFRLRTPKLVPDDTEESIWSKPSTLAPLKNLKLGNLGVLSGLSEDSRIGQALILGALISFGTIWLRRSQPVQPSQSNQST